MLITVKRIETVSCDHNGQETHRWTFQVFQYYSKRTAKIKLPRRKNVKALVLFEMYERSERYKNPSKTSFRKAEKATVSIMFGKLTFISLFWFLDLWNLWAEGSRKSLFSTANEGQ